MRRVLIVEDDDFKVKDILAFFPSWRSEVAKSVRDGVVSITEQSYDLIVLDMSLPTYEKTKRSGSGSSQAQGGLEILREIKASGDRTKLIIVSQYPDIELEGISIPLEESPEVLAERYNANVCRAIIYDSDNVSWATKFKEALDAI